MKTSYNIAVLPGDGIGVEVMAVCLKLLEHLQKQSNEFQLKLKQYPAGAAHYRDVGDALPQGTWEACRDADAILFGAMGLPEVRYPDGTEIGPQLTLRQHLDLFAGVRPIRAIPGAPLALADSRAKLIDLVIVREQSKGWFFGRYHPEKVPKASVDEAYDLGRITRQGSERLFHFAFELAQHRGERLRRPPRVTCVDKSNVHRGQAFMFSIFKEVAQAYPQVHADECYIDAMALYFVKQPWHYDVLPTENQFGDILSDLGAALIGGMGMAPSADIGPEHALFQPSHGTAPDIAGQGVANPTAMFLSAAMMLQWLGTRHQHPALLQAAIRIEKAVDRAFSDQALRTPDLGGGHGTLEVYQAVISAL
ncbi:MAG: hypothetical protein RL539_1360 [Pseudomonadota bacterium]